LIRHARQSGYAGRWPAARRRRAPYRLTKRRRDALNSLARFRRQTLERCQNFLVRHAAAEIGPSVRLLLNATELFFFGVRQMATGSSHERVHVEFDLLRQAVVE